MQIVHCLDWFTLHLAHCFVESSEPPSRGNQVLSWITLAQFMMSSISRHKASMIQLQILQWVWSLFLVCGGFFPLNMLMVHVHEQKFDCSLIWLQHTMPILILMTFAFCEMLSENTVVIKVAFGSWHGNLKQPQHYTLG